ncbi:MAG: L-histidine N(alpha)-methyltransferase [Cyanobacteria bacterium RI_101]|nr:L-histidine N(alpha)-methyltransferase [Cyanobacteria bacterium RI_101]
MTLRFYDFHPSLGDMRTEILQGLRQPQKAIAPKFLYDKTGAELFNAVCELPEYYLTRAEMAILQSRGEEIARLIGDGALVEFGSGSCQKVQILLDAQRRLNNGALSAYVSLDISKEHLLESCQKLAALYPELETDAICADYTQPLVWPEELARRRKVGFFPGSSIGNLEPQEALTFLADSRRLLGPEGGLLIGVDLQKSAAILEPAYADAQGISAAFALNLLRRLNRELGADFDLERFTYRAFYNPLGRIEMSLVSLREQTVRVAGEVVVFRAGESLLTEYSYKYSVDGFQALARKAGYQPKQVWLDEDRLFSVHYLQV